jgi:hypothetical protein
MKLLNFDVKEEEKPLDIEYDDQGYIKSVSNNGKLFKFERGKLL